MTPDISVGRPAHLTSDEAYAEIAERYGVEEISDACARTIASWWQGPGAWSRELTRLSTQGVFNPGVLLQEISAVRSEVATNNDHHALDMLATWAMHRHDEEVE